MKKTIVFFHQSADLYGSDKVVLNLAIALKNSTEFLPVVMLPYTGPLVNELARHHIETHILPLTKVSRALLSVKGILSLPFSLFRSIKAINKVLRGREIALVHSNTLAMLSGAIWAKLCRIPHIWHIHEILYAPRLVSKGFPLLVRLFADRVICNSSVTRQWLLDEQPCLAKCSVTIWNGIERLSVPDTKEISIFKNTVGAIAPEMLTVTLMGRINHMKGHALLVEASTVLWHRGYTNIRYAIVGSVYGDQHHFLENLKASIAQAPAKNNFTLFDFTDSIWNVWDASDIAVVPSTEAEAFGLVAAEAMCAGKPVIASAIGGLLDVVVNDVTGYLVKPKDAQQLANAIAQLVDDAQLRLCMGQAGQQRQQKLFSLHSQIEQTFACYKAIMK